MSREKDSWDMGTALEGVKVLDFCWIIVGPMTTRYMADFGATVVRVESRHRPCVIRGTPPFAHGKEDLNSSGYFSNFNGNKYSLSLNMAHPKSREIVTRLVLWADFVTENFTPGTMEKWGFGYDNLRKINPSVILFSTSMLGRGGPHSKQPGFGPVLSSLAGMTHMTGWPDRDPCNPYGAYTDFIAPRFAVAAMLAALDRRRRTGEGVHIDMSQLEAGLQFLTPILLDQTVNEHENIRNGNRSEYGAPHGIYPCVGDDKWIAIAIFSDSEWKALREVMQGREWVWSNRFETMEDRKLHEDELDNLMAAWTGHLEQATLTSMLQEIGISAGPVANNSDLFNDSQLLFRRHFIPMDHPTMGVHPTQGVEFQLSATPARFQYPSPVLGEHTESILVDFGGYTMEEIESMKKDHLLE